MIPIFHSEYLGKINYKKWQKDKIYTIYSAQTWFNIQYIEYYTFS